MLRALLVIAMLAVPALTQAQGADGYRLSIYRVGAIAPVTFLEFAATATTCNLAPTQPPAGASAVNPTRAQWDDPVNAGRACQWVDPGNGPLMAVPVGESYEATLLAYNTEGRSPESNRVPFTRLGPPMTAPAGLRLLRVGS